MAKLAISGRSAIFRQILEIGVRARFSRQYAVWVCVGLFLISILDSGPSGQTPTPGQINHANDREDRNI